MIIVKATRVDDSSESVKLSKLGLNHVHAEFTPKFDTSDIAKIELLDNPVTNGGTGIPPLDGYPAGTSYYIDTNGAYHPFTAANTPLVNFCFTGSNNDQTPIIVEGASVQRDTIMSIVFGEDYNSNEAIAPGFLRVFNSLKKSDISSIGISCSEIGINFLSWDIQNQELDLSKFTSLESIGSGICYSNYNLKTIRIGSVDFSNISVNLDLAFGLIPNESTRTIYADTQALADAFKAKYPMLSNWSVMVNPTFMSITFDRRCTPENPFYIRWINKDGGYDYYMLENRQMTEFAVSDIDLFRPFIADTERATHTKETIRISHSVSVTAGASQVDKKTFGVLANISVSPLIELYDRDKGRWIQIVLSGNQSNTWTSDSPTGDVSFKFELPVYNTQF